MQLLPVDAEPHRRAVIAVLPPGSDRGDDITDGALCARLWANRGAEFGHSAVMSDLTGPIIILSNLDCSTREGVAALAERAVDGTLRAIAGRVDDVGLGK